MRHALGVARVLVAYASKRGSTAEIAQRIGDVLAQSGLSVDCAPAGDVQSLDDYDAVVLGSAVYIRHWRGEATHFLRKHGDALAKAPLWVFSSGPVGAPDEKPPSDAWTEPPRIVKKVERLGAREHVVFGGRVPLQPRGPIERAMAKNTPAEYQDRRDWDEISRWARAIAAELRQEPESASARAA